MGEGFYVDTDVLYEAYRNFAGESGRHSITKQWFCKDLYAYDMRFTNRRVRRANINGHLITGIKLIGHTDTIQLESGELFQVKSLPGSTVITGKTIHGEES